MPGEGAVLSKVLNDESFYKLEIDHKAVWRLIMRCNSRIPEGSSTKGKIVPAIGPFMSLWVLQRNRQLLRAGPG